MVSPTLTLDEARGIATHIARFHASLRRDQQSLTNRNRWRSTIEQPIAHWPVTQSMTADNQTGKVTVEVELENPSEWDEPFETLIKVRIVGTERRAFQMVKEAVLLAIQRALSDGD